MVIGSKTTFGLEYLIDGPLFVNGQKWAYGHLCYWAGDRRIGDFDEICSLSVAAASIRPLLAKPGDRYAPELLEMPVDELFNLLYQALYRDDDRLNEQIMEDVLNFGRFLAIPTGLDVFDEWMAFLIVNDHKARLIWKELSHDASEVFNVELPTGEFERVNELFLIEFEKL